MAHIALLLEGLDPTDVYHPEGTQTAVQHAVETQKSCFLFTGGVWSQWKAAVPSLGTEGLHTEGHGADSGGPFHRDRMTSSTHG